ncbi:hypothetical protein PtA15_5A237 [Puccinia triticina]|uniref:RING-type domain-containing protein n=1 Tax=Puccinia triticina TaxID=208348 RepID=A0ABY7CHS4_9BASI|nr:uncharacterized protein PtA15_5A237 [Puccinia triticina]WAQ84664.1 hypothetical protein PtA15_5A237 [Puccinia triticina]WAR58010.1 hypothetical protein PtB15_5B240 [Puccinia triticina]
MPTTNVIVLPTCSICRDNEDECLNFVVTKCGHLFHADCMKEWNRHERDRNATSRCPYCNNRLAANCDNYYGGDTDTLIRVHQLIKHRVAIIEDGKPSPEEELKAARDNLNSIKTILNKESDKLRAAEAEKAKIDAENKTLKSTIAKLTQDVKIIKEKTENRAAELKKEKQSRQKDLAIHAGEKDKLQKQIVDSKHFYEKVRNERGELQKELGKKIGENQKLRGIMTNQTNLISTLQAQSMQLNRERDQLAEKLNAIRQTYLGQPMQAQAAQSNRNQHHYPVQALQSNQHFYQAPQVDQATSDQLVNVLQGLSGGFLKLEREYEGIKKLLEENSNKDGGGRRLQNSKKENRQIQAYTEPSQDRLLHTSQATHFSSDPITDSIQKKASEMPGLVQKMESLAPPSTSAADQMIDPRLFG